MNARLVLGLGRDAPPAPPRKLTTAPSRVSLTGLQLRGWGGVAPATSPVRLSKWTMGPWPCRTLWNSCVN